MRKHFLAFTYEKKAGSIPAGTVQTKSPRLITGEYFLTPFLFGFIFQIIILKNNLFPFIIIIWQMMLTEMRLTSL